MTVQQPVRTSDEVGRGLSDGLVVAALAVGAGVLVGAGGAALAGVVAGRPQVLGAVLGVAVMTGFHVFGTVTVTVVASLVPRASLMVAMLTYLLQVGVLALVLAKVQGSEERTASVDVAWCAGTVAVATVAWLGILVVRALRSVPPVDELPTSGVGG